MPGRNHRRDSSLEIRPSYERQRRSGENQRNPNRVPRRSAPIRNSRASPRDPWYTRQKSGQKSYAQRRNEIERPRFRPDRSQSRSTTPPIQPSTPIRRHPNLAKMSASDRWRYLTILIETLKSNVHDLDSFTNLIRPTENDMDWFPENTVVYVQCPQLASARTTDRPEVGLNTCYVNPYNRENPVGHLLQESRNSQQPRTMNGGFHGLWRFPLRDAPTTPLASLSDTTLVQDNDSPDLAGLSDHQNRRGLHQLASNGLPVQEYEL